MVIVRCSHSETVAGINSGVGGHRLSNNAGQQSRDVPLLLSHWRMGCGQSAGVGGPGGMAAAQAEVEARVLRGDPAAVLRPAPRTLRVFVSSTFTGTHGGQW